MARWSEAKFNEIVARGRCDGEYHSHSAKSIEHWLSSSGHLLYRLRDCCIRITSGHTPLRHDLAIGNVFFVTVECVSPLLINYELTKKVETKHYAGELNRVALDEASVVVTIKRRIAQASPCYNLKGQTVVNQDVAVLRLREGWNPGFVAAYLISRYGQSLADRERTEQMNPYLPVNKLGNLLIPHLAQEAQKEIDVLIRKRFEYLSDSETAYTEAQKCLESELGFDKLGFQKPVGYTARFSSVDISDTFNANRIDSQCFSPQAIFYHDWLFQHAQCNQLGQLLQYTLKGCQQVEANSGTIDYCSIKHISGRELINVSKCFSAQGMPLAFTNDLLLAITGATIGKIGIIKRYSQLAFSGDLLRLRVKENINPHYLLLVLDHSIGQVQFNRWITGSTNGHLAPRDIRRVLVPRLKKDSEERIALLVEESLAKRVESENLLEQAKTRVEQLIEAAAQS
jgi:type I restriction enzyme S subunit